MKKKKYHKELRKQGIKNFKRVLMLKCHVCGKYENKTLMLHSDEPGYFIGAETAAYLNCMRGYEIVKANSVSKSEILDMQKYIFQYVAKSAMSLLLQRTNLKKCLLQL